MKKMILALALFAGFTSMAGAAPAPVRAYGGDCESSTCSNRTADALIKTGKGNLIGIFVASSTSCTIKLWANTAASGTVLVDTFSASAATWYPLPFYFDVGLYLDVGGTCALTVSYN